MSRFGAGTLIAIIVTGLILLGLVILASASGSFSAEASNVFYKQIIWLALGVIAALFASKVDLFRMRKWVPYFGLFTVFLLIMVLIPGVGVRVNGSMRWFGVGFVRIQPSELAKLALVFALAYYLSYFQRDLRSFRKGFVIPVALIALPCMLIILEPDFGTAFLCGAIGFMLLFLAGARLSYLLPTLFSGVLVFAVAIMLDPIRLKRITSFLNVEGNKNDGAYQLWQGILAFGAGGLDGVGLGNGRQQLHFLPEAHTDFILSIIGEELGLFFTLGTALAFLAIFIIGLGQLRKAPELFTFTLGAGSLLFIVLQGLLNMGVVVGLLPTKGMGLPFISYGGASLFIMLVFVGILINCFRTWNTQPSIKAKEL